MVEAVVMFATAALAGGEHDATYSMTDPYQTYRQLVARVEAFGQAVRQRYAAQIMCHAGCDGCCYQPFTIFPVEAYHVVQAVAALPPTAQQQLRQHLSQAEDPLRIVEQPQPCVLLDDGRCRLYDGRPLICRMQGYPLFSTMIERPDGGQRDCCPLNFTDMALEDVEPNAVYNLDLVNQTLAAINHLFVPEREQPDQRVTIRQAVMQALDMLAAADDEESGAR